MLEEGENDFRTSSSILEPFGRLGTLQRIWNSLNVGDHRVKL